MKRYRDRERELRRKWKVKRKRKRSAKMTYKVLALPSPTVEVSSNHETMSKNTVTAAPAIEAPPGSVRVSLVFPPAMIAALRAAGFLAENTSEPYDIAVAAASMIRAAWHGGIRAVPVPLAPAAEALPPTAESPPADEFGTEAAATEESGDPIPVPNDSEEARRQAKFMARMSKVQALDPAFEESLVDVR
jgi:hypothetical protein